MVCVAQFSEANTNAADFNAVLSAFAAHWSRIPTQALCNHACGAVGAVEGVAGGPANGEAAEEDVGEGEGLLALDGIGYLGEQLGVVLADGLGEGRVGGDQGFYFVAAAAVDGERIIGTGCGI